MMSTSQTRFEGFPPEALDFYEDLEADNTKVFWTEHKHVYDQAVKQPLLALCDRLAPEFGSAKVFRPYRDVRFSKDKSPYKTAAAAVMHADGDGAGACYLQLSAAGLMLGAGYHEMASDQVARFRESVADDTLGNQLAQVLAGIEQAGHTVSGERLKTRPRDYSEDHPRIDLLRYKTLTAMHAYPPEPWLHTPEVADVVASVWREMAPLNTWLERNVGASHAARR
jgi:uncharacterized protein (TIGR02453 family)